MSALVIVAIAVCGVLSLIDIIALVDSTVDSEAKIACFANLVGHALTIVTLSLVLALRA